LHQRLRTPEKKEGGKVHFFQLMREKGDGHVRLAWRRYFDKACEGTIDFSTFCQGLLHLGVHCDIVSLWHDLGGDVNNSLTLHNVDVSGSQIMHYFGQWCTGVLGGTYEVFTTMDVQGTDQLTEADFVAGLDRLGFFSAPGLPERVASPELVLQNLFPVLDPHSHGVVRARDFLIWEANPTKQRLAKRELNLIARLGRDVAAETKLPKNAERMLFAPRRWHCEEWLAAYWDGSHKFPAASPTTQRPCSASLPSHSRRSSPRSPCVRRLARPASAPSLRRHAL
jgi:hypothetical protein